MRITLALVVAVVLAFVIGAASGYAARSLNSQVSVSTTNGAACPSGSHAVVWYTAKTWSCVGN